VQGCERLEARFARCSAVDFVLSLEARFARCSAVDFVFSGWTLGACIVFRV
jgi:hypothetical protein